MVAERSLLVRMDYYCCRVSSKNVRIEIPFNHSNGIVERIFQKKFDNLIECYLLCLFGKPRGFQVGSYDFLTSLPLADLYWIHVLSTETPYMKAITELFFFIEL